MRLIQDNHLIEHLVSDTPNELFYIRILPGGARGDHDFYDAHLPHPLLEGYAVDGIPITQHIPWGFFPRERLHHLLSCPLSCGMLGDVEMHNLPAVMGQSQQDEQHLAPIASSTTRPIASTKPKSDSVLIEKRNSGKMANVPTSETGTVSSGIKVARQPCRKM